MINVHKSRRVFQPNFVQLILKGWKHNFQEFCAMIWGNSCLQFCKKSADHKEGNTCSEVPIGQFLKVLGVKFYYKSSSNI